jgi:adenylyltransferase/sulfurtransferase
MTYFVPHVWLMKVLIFTALIITLSIFFKPLLYYYQRSQLDDISVTEFNTLRTQKVPIALIDARSDSEYQTEHIPDAISIPVQKIDTVKELVANKRLVTYCSTGARSYEALIILKKYQINGVNLNGGFEAWWEQANKSR